MKHKTDFIHALNSGRKKKPYSTVDIPSLWIGELVLAQQTRHEKSQLSINQLKKRSMRDQGENNSSAEDMVSDTLTVNSTQQDNLDF
jgi:hypothetical protein